MADLRFEDFKFSADFEDFKGEHRSVEEVRLMIVDARTRTIQEDMFSNLGRYLEDNDLLAYNDVGIGPSRLEGRARDGRAVDVCFLLLEDEGATSSRWDAVVLSEDAAPTQGRFELSEGAIPGSFLGKRLDFDGSYWIEKDRYNGYRGIVEVDQPAAAVRELLSARGKLMHPWYADLNKLDPALVNPDITKKNIGALVSEPARRITAEMRQAFRSRGIAELYFSLAMSFSWRLAGPEDRLDEYSMNDEELCFDQQNIERLKEAVAEGRRIVCVGTSAARALESLPCPPRPFNGRTNLFISPGMEFKYCSCLLTNLHNPMGTHVIMAAAFGGRDLVLEACERAVQSKMKFGIHGDGMLVIGNHGLAAS